jgi:hypothetical protein
MGRVLNIMTAFADPLRHSAPVRGPLGRKAMAVRAMGSPFIATILATGERQLWRAPRTATLIATWPGDAAADALAMRFNAGLHALARGGSLPALTRLYAAQAGDFDTVLGDAMAVADDFLADWMRDPPQTNEIGRAAAIMAALMVLRDHHDMPCELRELGASAGLNLNLDRYGYDLGGLAVGTAGSPVRIAPRWSGEAPPVRPVEVRSAKGIDLRPLDATDAVTHARLMAHVWADEPDRADRLNHAIAVAHRHPPQVEQGNIIEWLPTQLKMPQPDGICRVVLHSMAIQYLDVADRQAVDALLQDAGARATAERPLARIAYEWTEARDAVHLSLTIWPSGRTVHLATCHAYGAWVDWHGPADA